VPQKLGLAREQAVSCAEFAQEDPPRKAKFAAAWIGANLAAGRRHRHLQSPAAAEERHADREHSLGEFDLTRDRCATVIDVERRARHGDAVVVGEADAWGKVGSASAGASRMSTRSEASMCRRTRA